MRRIPKRAIICAIQQSMSMSIAMRSGHKCHHHYELKNYKKIFSCDACKRKGYGQHYHCNICGDELHIECRSPETTISHENFGNSVFKFRRKPLTRLGKNNRKEFSKCCDACGKDICGFSYRCEEKDKDLHPCCRNLKKQLLIDNTVFDLRAEVLSKCSHCKKKKITDGDRDVRGWSYVSGCNKYHFHVFCMVEMVHETCMRYGETGLETVELREIARSRRSRGSRGSKIFEMIKSVMKILLAALLGDPTMLISNVFVELVSRGLQ